MLNSTPRSKIFVGANCHRRIRAGDPRFRLATSGEVIG